LHGINFEAEVKSHKYQRLTLPLSSDGLTVDKLLAVSIEDGKFWATISEASRHAERRHTE